MRDLKQCLLDFLRSGGISVGDNNNNSGNTNQTLPTSKVLQKPKKLHEYTAADCNAAFLRKYYDVGNGNCNAPNNGVIYFNENLTMASKYDMRQFPINRYPLSTCSNSDDSVSPMSSKSDDQTTIDDAESCPCNDSSEEDCTTLIDYCEHNNLNNVKTTLNNCCDNDDALLDSFCTLCTSSFSYNKCCRYCDNSQCGSKCNSERGSHTSRRNQHHKLKVQCNNMNFG